MAAAGMLPDPLEQLFHLPQDTLALPRTVLSPPAVGHLQTQPIHLPGKLLRFHRHAMAQTHLLADQPDRFKQRARYILEQHPVRRPMNVDFQTSAVDQANGGVYRLVQSHLPGQIGIAHHLSQGPVQSPQLLFPEKLRGPLHSALGDAPDGVDLPDTAKIGQQLAPAQSPRQVPKRNPPEQMAQRFHAQCLDGKTGLPRPGL